MESTVTIEDLLCLQDLDQRIGGCRAELNALLPELAEMETEIGALSGKLDRLRTSLEEAEGTQHRLERTVQAGRATFKRLQLREQEVKNMRQHLAARAESEAARRNLDEAEDELLDAMQDVERIRAQLAEVEETSGETSERYRIRKAEIEAERVALEDQLHVHSDQRANRSLHVDQEVLQLYDRVRKGRTTAALAPIVDGVCGQCFTAIPLQRQAEIRSGRQLQVCEACGVILHAATVSADA